MELVASDLSVYLSGRKVLANAGIALASGEVVGLLGPNGAGKSTLLRAVAGQVQSDGDITAGGRDLKTMPSAERARLIAYLPQARIISWPLSVRNLVALGRMPWHGFGQGFSARDHEICAEAMELMDVSALAGRVSTELSGGEQARVLAARAVAQDTPILLADEPASGLDPAHQIMMMAALRRLAAAGRGILVSLHDLTIAARWCDRVVVLKDGRIRAEGKPAEVMTPDLLRTVFAVRAHIAKDTDGVILTPIALAD
jgi:iron complex transport system ATP-binding protein